MSWYDNIPGIDVKMGIENSGSKDTYGDVLKVFLELIAPGKAELCGYYDSGNWKDYTTRAHSLKSAALLAGAKDVADGAFSLEDAGKREDIDFIRNNHAAVMERLDELEKNLSAALKNADTDGRQAGFADDFIRDGILETIADAAADRDDELISETFAEAGEYVFSAVDTQRLDNLKKLFENGQYDEMIDYIKESKE